MMRNKAKWLAILIFFTLCLGLLAVMVIPLPYEGLDWLSLGPAIAAQYDKSTPVPPGRVTPGGQKGVFDPDGAKDITFDFPPNSVPTEAELKAFRIGELPDDVSAPANGIIGSAILAGVWADGKTLYPYARSITIHVPYPQQPNPDQESLIRLNMYDPTAATWVKLCSRTDTEGNQVSSALVFPTPLMEGGNALFALTVDSTPALNQMVDDQGKTTLSIPGNNFKLGVLPGTVEVGTHFEITPLTNAPDSGTFRLLPTPMDVKACQADYTEPGAIRQVIQFPKPMEVEFEFDANTANRASGKANLTIVSLQKRQWVDLEEAGSRIVRGDISLTVDSDTLSSFSLAAR